MPDFLAHRPCFFGVMQGRVGLAEVQVRLGEPYVGAASDIVLLALLKHGEGALVGGDGFPAAPLPEQDLSVTVAAKCFTETVLNLHP